MRRREFITFVGVAAIGWPYAARTQGSPPRIGFIYSGSATSPASKRVIGLIKQGLRESGLTEEKDYVFDVRFAGGHYERFPLIAHELAQAGARVIIASTVPSVRAAQELSPPLPVVIAAVLNPVGNGLVTSLAQPGGHTTGVGLMNADLTIKLLEFQRAVLPKARAIGVLYNPATPANVVALDNLLLKADAFGFSIVPFALKSPDQIDTVFAYLAQRTPDLLQVIQDAGILDSAERITKAALRQGLPTFAETRLIPGNGGLLSYGPQMGPLFVRSGYFVARILQGTKPEDLPVEQPALFELVINLRTAKALSIEIPPALLAVANEVIE
jgi:putative ABC transport system substrate-binding protein